MEIDRGRPTKFSHEKEMVITTMWFTKSVDIPFLVKKFNSSNTQIKNIIKRNAKEVIEKYGLQNTIECTKEVNKHCVYGTVENYKYCRYCIVEGKSRNCNAKFCNKYIAGTPFDKDERKEEKRKYVENVYTNISR